MFESLRTRLTLWYVGILAAVLVAFSISVYTLVECNLHAHQDGRLRSVLKISAEALSKSSQSQGSIELRTPLSVMRTAAQVALQKPQREEAEYREAPGTIEQQTQRLGRVVNDMFREMITTTMSNMLRIAAMASALVAKPEL